MWQKIGRVLWNAMLQSHYIGKLYRSARRGVISLIPKVGKDALNLAGWRPICLLNNDLKMVTKMITSRLKPFLCEVIGKQQTDYVHGRFIGMNVRKMIDINQHIEQGNLCAVVMSIDFEKCFDSIDHHSLFESLRFFLVSEYIISWIAMIYKGFELCVINNGRCSKYFPQNRGVHQGSALSGPIFLYPGEILALRIKKNPDIIGVTINGIEEKLGQYADDTNVWSKYCEASLNQIIDKLETLYKNTGLKVNYEKTTLYKIGNCPNKRLYLKKKFKWGGKMINTLSLAIAIGELNEQSDENVEHTFEEIISKASSIMLNWSNRGISLCGKISVVNTLINSLFVYKMQMLPSINKNVIAKINGLISRFIWNARKPKLRLEILQMKYCNGGRKLGNLLYRDMSLKIEWIRRLHCDEMDPMLTTVAYKLINAKITNELLWECNFCEDDVAEFKCKSPFWKSVLIAWSTYNYEDPKEDEAKANQIIWFNSNIKICGKMIFVEKWYDKGIIYVKDLVVNGQILSFLEMCQMFNEDLNVMTYNSVISAIPRDWRKAAENAGECEWQSKYGYLCEKQKWSKCIYDALIKRNSCIEDKSNKLSKVIGTEISEDEIQKAFVDINKYVDVTKYRAFQFRLLQNIVLLNDRLIHMGIATENICSQCGLIKETITHFFWECKVTRNLLTQLTEYIEQINVDKQEYTLNIKTFMLNEVSEHPFSHINMLVCILKQKMYAFKCMKKGLKFRIVKDEYEFIHELERNEALLTGNIRKYNLRWPDKILREMDFETEENTVNME